MNARGHLAGRDVNPLHEAWTLLARQNKQCKDCSKEPPPECTACPDGQECVQLTPTDCTQCASAVCRAIESTQPANGGSKGGDGPNIGAIVGGVLGGLVVVAIVAFLVWKFLVKPKRSELAQSVLYAESHGAESAEKDGASRHARPPSTHTVHSIASTVLTRASNIIQIAYIPGVTNRAGPSSPAVLVPPVPPIPMQHAEGHRGGGEEGQDDQHFFVPGALRDSTYSGLSGYSDRTSYATRTSYAPRSSIASTIYGKSAHVFTSAQSGMRAKPTMVSVKSTSSGESTPPVPSLDVERFAPNRPQSTASTFSVGSTFLNNASTATAAPVRAQVVKVGGGPQVVKVGSGLKKVDASIRSNPSSSASSTTTATSVAELPGDDGSHLNPSGANSNAVSPASDQGPFSDPPAAKSAGASAQALGVVMEDEPDENDRLLDKKPPQVMVTPVQRGHSPFSDEHATRD